MKRGKYMLDKKGFTLVELLAVVSIIGVLLAIIIPVSINAYESSKTKTEAIFIERINKLIDDYIALSASDFNLNKSTYNIVRKCNLSTDTECEEVKAYRVSDNITFNNIVETGLIDENDFINPKNGQKCNLNSAIEIFQDEDKVNYFRYDLACISDANRNGDYVYDNVTFLNAGIE